MASMTDFIICKVIGILSMEQLFIRRALYILGFARGEYCRGALPSYESGLAKVVRLISRIHF